MHDEAGRRGIGNMCAAAESVLFSSTPFDCEEATHFDMRPPKHWGSSLLSRPLCAMSILRPHSLPLGTLASVLRMILQRD